MPQHERKNVRARLEFCNTCNRQTLHDVFDGRGSSCQNPHATRLSKKQEKAQKERQKAEDEPTLFSDNGLRISGLSAASDGYLIQ